jgi:phosphatidylinositol alpha-1,6-mannosyltransferase
MLVVPIACLLGWLFKRPVVAIGHGLDLIYPHPLYQKMVHTFLPRCQRVIAVSQVVREAAMDRGIDQDNVTIIPPGVQYEEFAGAIDVKAVRRTYALANRPVILSVGRLARRKGVLEFVRYALPQIVASFPQVVFLVVGDNPHLSLAHKEDMRTRIQDEVTRLGLATHVRLLGHIARQEVIQLYQACDVFVLPAIEVEGDVEGFGTVLIEASAAGKPVVATRLGGIPEAVEHGKTGILVEAGAWNDLANAIMHLLTDQTLRQHMGAYGRARTQARFDWSLLRWHYAELLASL